MYKTQGILRYNRGESTQRTLVLDLEPDDSFSYYDWMLRKQYGEYLKTQSPMWGRHVTVIKPVETVNKMDDWFLYEGEEVELFVFPEKLERHWTYWSLTVESRRLREIRSFYGVREDYRFHMSVGRQFEWQPTIIIPGMKHDVDYEFDFYNEYKDISELNLR